MASMNYQCQLIKNTVGQNKYYFPLQTCQHFYYTFLLHTRLLSISTHVDVHGASSLEVVHFIGFGLTHWLGVTLLLQLEYYVYKADILADVVDVECMSWWWCSHNPPLKQWTTLSWWLSAQQVPQQQRHWCYCRAASITVNTVFS